MSKINFHYITPAEAVALRIDPTRSLVDFTTDASTPPGICAVCNSEYVWRLYDTGLCYTCTTGTANPDEPPYELQEIE